MYTFFFKKHSESLRTNSCILLLDLDKGTCTCKNIILYFYSSTVMLVWSTRAVEESLHTKRCSWELEQLQELTSAKI